MPQASETALKHPSKPQKSPTPPLQKTISPVSGGAPRKVFNFKGFNALRGALGYTQKEIAQLVGGTKGLVKNWSCGYRNPSLKYQIRLARAGLMPYPAFFDSKLAILKQADFSGRSGAAEVPEPGRA